LVVEHFTEGSFVYQFAVAISDIFVGKLSNKFRA